MLVVDPIEAAVGRQEIFEVDVSGGLGGRAVAQRLNARGVPAPAALRRLGRAAWSTGSVWTILRNPTYTGTLVYGKARYREVGKKRGRRRLPEAEHVIVEQAGRISRGAKGGRPHIPRRNPDRHREAAGSPSLVSTAAR